MAIDILNILSDNLGETVLAVGALGTAAYGLVEVSKAFWGGAANAGFGHIRRGLTPYDEALSGAIGSNWADTLLAHWRNGRARDEQKSIARALVRLGLSPATAPAVAEAARVSPERLTEVAGKLNTGEELTEDDLNLLGRFDAVLESQLDAAFDRADQQYRSSARTLAAAASVLLALLAVALSSSGLNWEGFWLALAVGILAVPLAPVAKDLASALNAAMRAVRGGVS